MINYNVYDFVWLLLLLLLFSVPIISYSSYRYYHYRVLLKYTPRL
jgi:hypothetical protein